MCSMQREQFFEGFNLPLLESNAAQGSKAVVFHLANRVKWIREGRRIKITYGQNKSDPQ